MEAPRHAIRLAFAALATATVVGFILMGSSPTRSAAAPITTASGTPFSVPLQTSVTEANWHGQPVIVFVVLATQLDAVAVVRGDDAVTPSIVVPGHPELRLFVLSDKSTHLGCTVAWNPTLDASLDVSDYDGDGAPDGRLLDRCHQGSWDAFHRGAPVNGPAPTRLAVLDVEVRDGVLYGTHFDGPTGPAR